MVQVRKPKARGAAKTGLVPKPKIFAPELETGLVPISILKPAPENDLIYRAILPEDPDVIALSQSLRANGVLEPLVVTMDGYVLSGNRRLAAAKLAEIEEVPCRIEQIRRGDDLDAFTRRLAEYNRQRVKQFDEKLREEVLSIDPDDAHDQLVRYRNDASAVKLGAMKIRGTMNRSKISPARQPFLDAIIKIIQQYKKHLPISERKIHYALLNNPPLIHASKPKSRYANTKASTKALSDLVTRARLEGLIPFNALADETRPVLTWHIFDDVHLFVRDQIGGFLRNYWRNLQQSQPNHIEIVVEKNTILPIVKQIAGEYCLRVTSGRGYSSLPPRWEISERFKKSGKEKLVLLLLSDLDPDGAEIAESFARSMRDDFKIENIHCVRVALTTEQVRQFKLPNALEPKQTSSNYKKFVKRYGDKAYELEALEPGDLQQLLRDAIDGVLNHDAYQHEIDEERKEAAFLTGVRMNVLRALRQLGVDGVEGDADE